MSALQELGSVMISVSLLTGAIWLALYAADDLRKRGMSPTGRFLTALVVGAYPPLGLVLWLAVRVMVPTQEDRGPSRARGGTREAGPGIGNRRSRADTTG